ncbi:hypothetical protein [Streptomyces atratus]|nr:hypothetical protein [Streptomyces atratus]MCT2546899.1 hypothetical protein [Streptomyces atratus]
MVSRVARWMSWWTYSRMRGAGLVVDEAEPVQDVQGVDRLLEGGR